MPLYLSIIYALTHDEKILSKFVSDITKLLPDFSLFSESPHTFAPETGGKPL